MLCQNFPERLYPLFLLSFEVPSDEEIELSGDQGSHMHPKINSNLLRGAVSFLEIVFVGQCEVFVCL